MTCLASGRQVRIRVTILAVLAVLMIEGDTPAAHEHIHTHRKLTAAAFRLLNSDFFRNHADGEEFIIGQIAQGAIDEDNCIGTSLGRNWEFHPNYFSHFLPTLTGVSPVATAGCSIDGQTATDAATRAGRLWSMARDDYLAGKRQSAYRILGRVLHLLEDMTSPAHVHDDPHGKLLPSCGQDADDFENWGHCDGQFDHISDYVIDGSAHRPCSPVNGIVVGDPIHATITCRLWWALERLYGGRPAGGTGSEDPVVPTTSELDAHRNIAFSYIRHVRDFTRTFTFFRADLLDPTNATDVQPDSELRRMLRGSTINDCGFGVTDNGLCDVANGWTISGPHQAIGGTLGQCYRSEGTGDIREEWWLGGPGCTRNEEGGLHNPTQVFGYAYLENSGGDSAAPFIPLRYGCAAAESEHCGDLHGTVTARSKPFFARLYGDHANHQDPFVPVASTGKTQLRIYGDVLYATAVAYGAGLLEAFVESVDDPSTVTLDKTALRFGAVTDGFTFLSQTSAQTVQLTESGHGHVPWTASSNRPWLSVTPSSGTGSASLSIAVRSTGAPATGEATGSITFTLGNTPSTVGPVAVTLSTTTASASTPPSGFVDTPLDNTTGVAGSMPVTGWAIDDIEVARVMICRGATTGEAPGANADCGGAANIYLGDAVFIDGARPDIQAAFPHVPRNSRAGWGFMVLTNMLPGGGNGVYSFHVYAIDREGKSAFLGTRTITAANAASVKPFGAIDTPAQGGTASGSNYINFGWALTPLPKTIPTDGSTIAVLIDGVSVGQATYNNARSDIAGLFPGLNNSGGAVGFKPIDTSTLTNGLHTIVWVVSDDHGATEGIGSRYFNVVNGAGFLTAAATSAPPRMSPSSLTSLPMDRSPTWGRRGLDANAPWQAYRPGGTGRTIVRGEEIDRIELQFDAGPSDQYAGYLRVAGELNALPVGSSLDAARGRFIWQPGVGFVGAYDLVFVRSTDNLPTSYAEVRVILAPKGTGRVGPQVVIDVPRSQVAVSQPFMVGGWAVDLNATSGTGIAAVHVWAYPIGGGAPTFVGTAAHGPRSDVAALHGDRFIDAGYGLFVQGLVPGGYDLAVFAWSTEAGDFVPAKVVRVNVQ